jgi:hypothetical protein
MCCTPGRCPCWPREQPFDASEIRVLTCIRNLLGTAVGSYHCRARFEEVKEASTPVDRRRLSYVLSTSVRGYAVYSVYSQTLLTYVSYDKHFSEWVLNVGVCPNVGGSFQLSDGDYHGWQGGSLHPGRPPLRGLCLSLEYASCNDYSAVSRLMAYGAYPIATDRQQRGKRFKLLRSDAQRQWYRWHARASRRQWLSVF